MSGGSERVSTSQYALSVAVDQAWNPFNYASWMRGAPDFEVKYARAADDSLRRKIPLQRASIAVMIALLVLVAEAAFFWGTKPKTVPLTEKQLKIAVNQTNTNHGTKTRRNTCEPIYLMQGRAKLNAVFAACNVMRGTESPIGSGTTLSATIFRTQFSIGIEIKGAQNLSSETTFTLLVPRFENLVVRLKGNVQQTPSDLVRQYYQASGCRLSGQAVDKLTLSDCTRKVDAYSALEILVQYIGVVQDGPPGKDVGRPVGELLETSSGDIEVGSIVLLNYTAGTILAISVVLFVVAVFCRAFVVDDTSKVIACMLRERTGQDTSIPTVAMGDGEVRILRSFSKEKQESYVGTVIPDGYEEMMS